jgi:hypothetical protein
VLARRFGLKRSQRAWVLSSAIVLFVGRLSCFTLLRIQG